MSWQMWVLAVAGYLLVGSVLTGITWALMIRADSRKYLHVKKRSDLFDDVYSFDSETVGPLCLGVVFWPAGLAVAVLVGAVIGAPMTAWLLLRRKIIVREIAKKLEGEGQKEPSTQWASQMPLGLSRAMSPFSVAAIQQALGQLNLPLGGTPPTKK